MCIAFKGFRKTGSDVKILTTEFDRYPLICLYVTSASRHQDGLSAENSPVVIQTTQRWVFTVRTHLTLIPWILAPNSFYSQWLSTIISNLQNLGDSSMEFRGLLTRLAMTIVSYMSGSWLMPRVNCSPRGGWPVDRSKQWPSSKRCSSSYSAVTTPVTWRYTLIYKINLCQT